MLRSTTPFGQAFRTQQGPRNLLRYMKFPPVPVRPSFGSRTSRTGSVPRPEARVSKHSVRISENLPSQDRWSAPVAGRRRVGAGA